MRHMPGFFFAAHFAKASLPEHQVAARVVAPARANAFASTMAIVEVVENPQSFVMTDATGRASISSSPAATEESR